MINLKILSSIDIFDIKINNITVERDDKMKKKNIHIIPGSDGKWNVKKEGNKRATSIHDTQKKAIDAGRDIARKNRSENVIHGRDRKIRDKDSYGNNPYPPKG